MAELESAVAPPAAPARALAPPAQGRAALGAALRLWLTVRVALWAYAFWRLLGEPNRTEIGIWLELLPKRDSPLYPFLGAWSHWDALWYKRIALAGYHAGDNTVHFPPVFPLASRLAMPLVGGNFEAAALLVNGLAAIAIFAILERLAALDRGRPEEGRRAALYLCAYPVGFFLFAPFTEATFLAFALGAFLCARRGHWWWAGGLGALSALSRWQGVLLAPALLVEYGQQFRCGRWRLGPAVVANAAASALPGLGYLYFTLYVRYVVGEPRGMGAVNGNWGIVWHPPWDVLGLSLAQIRAPNGAPGVPAIHMGGAGTELLNFVAVCAVIAACLVGVRALRPSYEVFMAAQLLFTVTHSSDISALASAARYLLAAFPAFLLLGRAGADPRLHRAVLVLFLLLQGLWLWRYLLGEWVM